MGCGSSTPVVASTATTPRELSVRSGTASLLSSEGTPAGRFLSPGSLSELEAHPKLTPPDDSKQVGWLKSLRGAGSRTGPMGRSLPPFQRGFSSHSKHDVCCSSSARRRSRFFSACTPRPRGSKGPPALTCPSPISLRRGSFGADVDAAVRAIEELHAPRRRSPSGIDQPGLELSPEGVDQPGRGGGDDREGARAEARPGGAHAGG